PADNCLILVVRTDALAWRPQPPPQNRRLPDALVPDLGRGLTSRVLTNGYRLRPMCAVVFRSPLPGDQASSGPYHGRWRHQACFASMTIPPIKAGLLPQ